MALWKYFQRNRLTSTMGILLVAAATALFWFGQLQSPAGSQNLKTKNSSSAAPPIIRDEHLFNITAEDKSLQQYIKLASEHNVTTSSLRAVITILAYKPREKKLKHCLQKLYANFNNQFGYPVILFHEADFQPYLAAVRSTGFNPLLNLSSIFFQQVDMSVPSSYIAEFGQPPKKGCGAKNSIGYRSMCRFQAKLIYEEPMMRHFDYQLRLDDDSVLEKPISFDLFAALRDARCSYGYVQTILDSCAHNTFQVAADYMRMRAISPTFFDRLKRNEVFFNNFEVSSLKVWRSQQYRDFLEHVDSLGGFYTHRWGDAPIKTMALSMIVPETEICKFNNVTYKHHGLNNKRLKTEFLH
ncbi:hypothetical protein BOX15_Mlig021855g1 [Macrostomum lignano]|uniref:Uncharacterized protein n=1 Tax=Macrostomum lignano TaxID=282301 RepID=A0A267F2U4_9PLAT|nr:hypothetical protein BOX15_Mlig021855g1 [Macrostomum lignano]